MSELDAIPTEETVPVVLAVPNGLERDGEPLYVQRVFEVTTTTLLAVQALLENGITDDVGIKVAMTAMDIAGCGVEPGLAEQIAAHLAEKGRLA
ncbi:hypothetical protein [Puerhibacterium puerhi]|uniref:hypothetical protein n=1 Tax=Puerhibacterium puerhi TaxID=2692623 RepID=UPI00135CB307|nr:hypothetical protein [Puerhibacterium puerhi]